MDIEQVAVETPELLHKEPIDISIGMQVEQAERLAEFMGFKGKQIPQTCHVIQNLYKLFIEKDSTLIEINPLAETHDGKVMCLDAKLNFDDNAQFRQKELFEMRDTTQEDPREVAAEKMGLNYIGLDGNIGCLVNGAGLAMATMDVIKLFGGEPANFLDLGGGATEKQVTEAFALLDRDPKVQAILVNIFGGIMRCDVIAQGLLQAVTTLNIKKPLVVRLAGTNVDEAKKLIEDSGLRMVTADDLGDGAHASVQIVDIMKRARDAKLDVQFNLPL
jgi:succinyl-CoA synthetase beta subunit